MAKSRSFLVQTTCEASLCLRCACMCSRLLSIARTQTTRLHPGFASHHLKSRRGFHLHSAYVVIQRHQQRKRLTDAATAATNADLRKAVTTAAFLPQHQAAQSFQRVQHWLD